MTDERLPKWLAGWVRFMDQMDAIGIHKYADFLRRKKRVEAEIARRKARND
jgi:hypothetical protein